MTGFNPGFPNVPTQANTTMQETYEGAIKRASGAPAAEEAGATGAGAGTSAGAGGSGAAGASKAGFDGRPPPAAS